MFKNILKLNNNDVIDEMESSDLYNLDDKLVSGNNMILLEPRAYSEAQQIVEYLKSKNIVVVNLKRVTGDQAKRIIDFISGAICAISGNIQKIGGGIFLCTPSTVNIQGNITEETRGKDIHDNGDLNIEI